MKKLFFLILFAVNLSFSQNLQVSGAGTGSVNGIYTESGTLNSKPLYVNGSNQILWDGFWIIGDPNMPSYYSFANVASPDLVSSWNVYFGNPPSPTVSIAGPKLSYSGSFIENRESNNGSISSSMTISFNGFGGSSFTGANGDNFVTAGKVSIANLPSGLTAVMTRNSATQLTFTLTGNASAHANANDLSNLSVVFQNAAFSTGNASAVSSYSKSDISIEFIQQYTVGSIGNFTTISNAIASVQNYDVLLLAAETFTESNISINNKSISIIGQSPSQTIIQANANPGVAASRIFTINFSNYASTNAIRFEKLTIRNGNATNYAGGLFSSNANVEIENCLFENNYANTPVPDGYFGDGGGAMRVQDGSLSVLNSTFSGNRHNCVSNRPGDMMGGGAIGYFGQDSYNTLLNITNCTFTDNSTGNHGGAIMLRPSNTAANRIVNCTFSGNSAGNNGGALYFGGTGACQFSSTNSIYYGNTAGAYVSLYASFGSTFSFNNCVIQDNENVGNMSATYTNCIINQNPLLSALSDNGGYTKTLALQSGSVAINTGITSDEVPTNDQRGFSRVGLVDIGSHEFVDNTCVTPTENITTASSCDSYTWSNNGETYTESGTYIGTTENCVTEVLELTITPNSNNVTVASSCGSYTWSNNGETYTESGTYTGTTENCVTEVLELTVISPSENITTVSSCGSYIWSNNGATYTESGTYTGTTENCVTEVLELTVTSPSENITTVSSCGSYTWSNNGATYTESGTYTGTTENCVTEVLELTVTSPSENITTVSSCGSYTWSNNGATYTESGTYTGTIENCVTEVLELTVTSPSENITTVSSCGSYTWSNNGATYTESGTYTGTTENCVTEVLELTVTSPSENITTVSSCGSYTWSNNGATYTESGTYTGTIENCVTEVLELTVNPIQTPTVSIATSDLDFMICSGTNVLFTSTAVNGGSNPTYQWKINGVNVSGQNGPTFTTNSLTNGKIVTLQMISDAQCTSSNVAISNGIQASVGSCTKIQASQCGTIITSTSTSVWANSVSGATNYKFEFTDPSNNVFVYETANRYFKFSDISFTNNTTYSVRVAAKVGGSYLPYGAACDVRFEYQTKLVATQCGTSISSSTTVISAVNVAGATGYRFEITDPSNNVFIVNSATRTFTFSQFAYQNNTTYSIRVAVQTANGYSSYGAACSVTFDKRTQLQASQCGISIDNSTTVITANSMAGATAYRFELTDMTTSNVYYVNSTTRNFTFSQFAYENNTTYSVRVSALTGTVYSAYGAACTVTFDKRTQLQASQCGVTIDNPTTVITANSMAGATAYRFELTDMSTNNVYYVNSSTRNFTFSQFACENNTTYSVRVSALTGTMYSAYGAPCTVIFDKRTELQAEQCGLVINGASKLVYANSINGATAYRFEVTNLTTNTVYFVNSQTSSFTFSQFAYSNSANYSVRVSYLIGNVYSAYGTACTIGLEILTKVQTSQCGIQVSSGSTLVWAGDITSASSYKFELTDLNNNVTYIENATRNFKFNQFTYTPGMTYSVRVSSKTGSIYSNYGQACNVTAPGAPGAKPGDATTENKEPIDVNGLEVAGVNELQNAFDFNAYPNPSNGDFTVTCSEAVSLKIVNEMGQYIQSIEVTEANGNKVQVTDLPNGAYFITGTLGGKVITKKVIVVR